MRGASGKMRVAKVRVGICELKCELARDWSAIGKSSVYGSTEVMVPRASTHPLYPPVLISNYLPMFGDNSLPKLIF